jgi:hypothetical protein
VPRHRRRHSPDIHSNSRSIGSSPDTRSNRNISNSTDTRSNRNISNSPDTRRSNRNIRSNPDTRRSNRSIRSSPDTRRSNRSINSSGRNILPSNIRRSSTRHMARHRPRMHSRPSNRAGFWSLSASLPRWSPW